MTTSPKIKTGGAVVPERLLRFFERIERLYAREAELAEELESLHRQIGEAVGRSPGITYIVEGAGGWVKIGRTLNLTKRLRALQTAHSVPLRLVRQIPFDCERDLHRIFADRRTQGEWFEYDPRMETISIEEIVQ